MARDFPADEILETGDPACFDVITRGPGPEGELPLTAEMLLHRASGEAFGMTEDAGMGWDPAALAGLQFVMLSTMGGIRGGDGRPIALGHHTGNFELGLALEAAAAVFQQAGAVPYAAYCSDPCDGRTQGTPGMFDSLAYRNDAASVFRRQARSIPTAQGVLGVATCDKGLPAVMMALASFRDLPCVLVPGGVTLPPSEGEDTGKIQSVGARFARGELSLDDARRRACQVCASPGGGCHFFGTAASAQVVGEALGLALPHSALAPSGQPIWLDIARRSARALIALAGRGVSTGRIVTQDAVHNAMVVHAAFGGSTNMILHIPAIAHAAGLKRPTIDDWTQVNRTVPRLVDVLPNGPVNHPTLRAYLAGGVPEVMLHLRALGLLRLEAITVSGRALGEVLRWWEGSARRRALRERLRRADGVEPDDVILSPHRARQLGVTSTTCFPRGNLAPAGSVIKSTAIDRRVVDADGGFRKIGRARA
ncbi:MAG: dihydroxy-acid dehydratase, partial [Pirellulales bacterium]|nr:dihydroxy-acid dehydratase [Pirellulales bacterium]